MSCQKNDKNGQKDKVIHDKTMMSKAELKKFLTGEGFGDFYDGLVASTPVLKRTSRSKKTKRSSRKSREL